jgi:hypothetical protein
MAATRPPILAPPGLAPLRLEVAEQVPAAEWDAEVRGLGGCLYHSSAWSAFRAADSSQPLFFRWSDAETGDLAGLAVGGRRPPTTSRLGRLASYVHIESPPATRRSGADFVEPLRRWAAAPERRPRLIEVQLGSFDPRSEWAPGEPPHPVPRVEFVVGTLEPEAILRSMRKGIRGQINKARRLGVEVRAGSTAADLLVFARLYERTARRLLATKGVAPNAARPEARAQTLEILARRGAARLYLAELDGTPVAGCLFGIWDGTAYYLQNGADGRARDCAAVHRVLHHAISEFAAEGFTRVNLGGVPATARDESSVDHGLYQFKSGFGTERIACLGGMLVLRAGRVRALTMARRHRELVRALRRRLGEPGTSAVRAAPRGR